MVGLIETARDYFKRFRDCKFQKEIIEYLEKREKEFSSIPVKNKNPVFEIIVGIRGAGKTEKIKKAENFYKNYLVIDPDVFRRDFLEYGGRDNKNKISSVIKDILVLYGISNGMNVSVQSGKWDEKRELFMYLAKNPDAFLIKRFKRPKYTTKVVIFCTNLVTSDFSASYRYFIKEQKYYVNPLGKEEKEYVLQSVKSIKNFLLKIKNGNQIKPYVTERKNCIETKKSRLNKTIDTIVFTDRKGLIKAFNLKNPKDMEQISSLFPFYYEAFLYRELYSTEIYREFKKAVETAVYAQKNKNKELLEIAVLYFSYIGYSIVANIENIGLHSAKEAEEIIEKIEKIRKDKNFAVFEKVKVKESNVKEIIKDFFNKKEKIFLKSVEKTEKKTVK
jgi:hypothetical protein